MVFELQPTLPTSVNIQATPNPLKKNSSTLRAELNIEGPQQKPLTTKAPTLSMINGEFQDNSQKFTSEGQGTYSASISAIKDGPLELTGYVQAESVDSALHSFAVDTSQVRVPNDGVSAAQVTIVSLNKFGYPAANIPFSIEQISGDGLLSLQESTDNSGFARLIFQAGIEQGLSLFKVSNGNTY